jgi:hypothetical protein
MPSTPVWALSVDLQTKSATFTSGLADAARGARASFADIRASAQEMGGDVSYSMTEARHGVMLLTEEFGVHLPRSLTSFIAGLGPVGAAMEAAFPFLAIVVGATLLLEHLVKLQEAGAAIDSDWKKIGDSASSALNKTKDAILQAEIEADKLSGNKLDALHKQLTLIDHQSMNELVSEFNKVGDEIDAVLGKSSRGAVMSRLLGEGAGNKVKAEFDSFKEQYQSALAMGQDSQARSTLVDEIIRAQDQLKKYQAMPQSNPWVKDAVHDYSELIGKLGTLNSLQDYNSTLNQKKKQNTVTEYDDSANRAEYASAEKYDSLIAKAHKQLNEELDKQADDFSKIQSARLESQVREQLRAEEETAQAAKLALEAAEQQHSAAVKANDEEIKGAEEVRRMSQLSITGAASAYAISKQQEQARIKALLEQEQKDLQAAHQREIAEQQSFIGQMQALAATSSGRAQVSALAQAAEAQDKLTASARQYNEEMARTTAAIQASDLATAKLNNSWRTFFGQSMQETKSLAATFRGDLQSSMQRATEAFSQGIAKSIVEGKSFGSVMQGVARQMTESMIQGLIQWAAQDLMTKLGMKATAGMLAGAQGTASMAAAPFPINASAPAFGASMMAASLAFADGGIVPGVGTGDIVPARLEPGEGVLTKKVMEGLTNRAKFGDSGSGGDTHVHHHVTNHIHAIDGASVKSMLEKHSGTFTNHFHNEVRKMNR